MNEYYEILGISPGATLAEIKSARNKMALKWHPDKNPENPEYASNKMKQINEAYEMLTTSSASDKIKNMFKEMYRQRHERQNNERQNNENFEKTLKEVISKSKMKSKENNEENEKNKKNNCNKIRKPFDSFSKIIIELDETVSSMSDKLKCKSDLTMFLNEIKLVNNSLWFFHFRKERGMELFYKLYLKYEGFTDCQPIKCVYEKILKFGTGFKYIYMCDMDD